MRRHIVALTLTCAAALTACASGADGRDAKGAVVPYLSERDLHRLGLVIEPPADGATSSLTQADVVGMADWSTGQYPDARPVRAVLRVATTTSAGRHVNGQFQPAVDHQLVWVLVAPDIKIYVSGPARPLGQTTSTGEFRGYEVDLLDADTGKDLKGYQFSVASG